VTPTEEERVPDDDVKIPRVADLLWPALKAVSEAGGSAMQDEVVDWVRRIAKMTDEQLAVLNQDGRPQVVDRTIRAIRALRRIGTLDSSQRGVYALTQDGTGHLRMGDADADAALRASYGDHRRRAAKKAAATKQSLRDKGTVEPGGALGAATEDGDEDGASLADDGWRIALLEILKGMTPAAFERLAKRILREAGFQKVDVVGRAGDGGIDGLGLYKMSLVSFPIYFQCKRYSGSVGAGVVRDFRGAMVGRGDKGLLITTGTFTPAARAEATRDGTPPVDLIDGTELCDLLLEYKVGVEVRTVRTITLDEAYFANV